MHNNTLIHPIMLAFLFNPTSIALIGASHTPGKLGHSILSNLRRLGYQGDLYPINPSAEGTILGLPVFGDIKSLPEVPDLVLIAIPAEYVNKEVEACAKKGVKNLVIISAGFKEVGGAGLKREEDLQKLILKHKLNLIGPNCLGIINTAIKMNASFAEGMPKKGNVSLISQSGAMAVAIIDWAYQSGLGFAKIVSMGNKAGLNENDLLEYLGDDPATEVILMYLESIDDGQKFMEIAKKVSLKKPIIAIKSGTSSAGEHAISSHTGALAGSDSAVAAAFLQCGIIRAESVEDLFDYARMFVNKNLPMGPRVAIVTNAGGPGIMATDAVARSQLQLATLSPKTQTELKKKLPVTAALGNPVDVIGDATPERYQHALEVLFKDKEVDALVVVLTPQIMTEVKKIAKLLITLSKKYPAKTVAAAFMGGKNIYQADQLFRKFHFPNFSYPERAVRALSRVYWYGQWKKQNHEVRITNNESSSDPELAEGRIKKQEVAAADYKKVKGIFSKKRKQGAKLGDAEVATILQAYGIDQPQSCLVKTEKSAVTCAENIGYPIVMKISSSDILHKTEVGGVRIDIHNSKQAKEAYNAILKNAKKKAPKAKIDGVLVMPMLSMGREVIVGAKVDPNFGHLVMFGLGGIYVEILKDVTFSVAPVSLPEARQMIQNIRTVALLTGARGEKSVDIEYLAEVIVRVSRLVTDYPQIREFEINPLIMNPDLGAVAVDARCIV